MQLPDNDGYSGQSPIKPFKPETLKTPEMSDWTCYLFGKPGNGFTLKYFPKKGQEPNRFHMFMQRLCFGFTWVKE